MLNLLSILNSHSGYEDFIPPTLEVLNDGSDGKHLAKSIQFNLFIIINIETNSHQKYIMDKRINRNLPTPKNRFNKYAEENDLKDT